MQPPELTLIVAATRSMGIGAHGAMPWNGLRREMQYFARVTTRLPPQVGLAIRHPPHREKRADGMQSPPGAVNAVIMGRKTWDSIPPRFRPLKDRLNIVITRSAAALPPGAAAPPSPPGEPVRVPSLEHALQCARAHGAVGRVFVVGGAQVYDAALGLSAARRVLLTSIQREFECDTFFPLDLAGGRAEGWARASQEELQEWTGQQVDEGGQEEAGTRYEFQMWEKVD